VYEIINKPRDNVSEIYPGRKSEGNRRENVGLIDCWR